MLERNTCVQVAEGSSTFMSIAHAFGAVSTVARTRPPRCISQHVVLSCCRRRRRRRCRCRYRCCCCHRRRCCCSLLLAVRCPPQEANPRLVVPCLLASAGADAGDNRADVASSGDTARDLTDSGGAKAIANNTVAETGLGHDAGTADHQHAET